MVQDLCASGGYYVAAGADRIYVDKASLVGSIGVIMGGFGFTGAMEKLGIERRAYHGGRGTRTSWIPFAPEKPSEQRAGARHVGPDPPAVHQGGAPGRGTRLKESPELFSGLIWTGEKSIELGLADAYGSTESVAALPDVIKAEKPSSNYTPGRTTFFETLSHRLGTSFGTALGRAAAESATRGLAELR